MSSAEPPVPAPPSVPKRRRSWVFYSGWAIIGLFIGILLWALSFPSSVVQTILAQAIPVLEDATQLHWRFDRSRVRVFGNTITVPDVSLLDPETDDTVATIDRLIVKLRWGRLTAREALADPEQVIRALRGIDMQGLTIAASRTPKGFDLVDLFSDRKTDDRIPPLNIRFAITDSQLQYTDYPMLATGKRDWSSPMQLTLGIESDAHFQEGVLTSAVLKVTPIENRKRVWWRVTGSADFTNGYSATITPDLSLEELRTAKLLDPILLMLGPTVAQSLQSVEAGHLTGQVLATGKFDGRQPDYAGDLKFADVSLRHMLLGSEPVTGSMNVTLNPVRWRLTDARFAQGTTTLTLLGAIDPRDPAMPIDGSFAVTDIELSRLPVELPFAESMDYQGTVYATGRINGTLTSPTLQATLIAPNLRLAGDAYELQPSGIEYANHIVRLNGHLAHGSTRVEIAGSADIMAATSAFQIDVHDLDAGWVRRALPDLAEVPVTGRFNAGVTVVSTPEVPMRAEVQLASTDGLVGGVAYRSLLGQLHLTGQTVAIDRMLVTLPGENGGVAMAHGTWDPARGFDLDAEMGGMSLAQLDPSRTVSGTAYATVHLSGTPESPTGHYTLQLLDGMLGPVPYRQLTQGGAITPSRATFDESLLAFEHGSVGLTGDIDLARAEQVNLTLDLSKLDGFVMGDLAIPTMDGNVRLHGPLNALAVDAEVAGRLAAAGIAVETVENEPASLHVDGLGLKFAHPPGNWIAVVDQMAWDESALPDSIALTHSAGFHITSAGVAPLVDPFLREAILEAAPALGALLVQDEARTASPVPIDGTLHTNGAWIWDGDEAVGTSQVTGTEFTIGPITLSQLTGTVSRARGERVQLEALVERFDGAAISLVGSLNPEPQWLASDLNLDVQLKEWPLSTFVALTGSGLEKQVEAKLTGGGILRGPLDALTTVGDSGDTPGHLRFLIADGRIADLTDITGLVVVGIQSGEVRVHGANLEAPDGFAVKGEGTVYLTSDRFSDSRATFSVSGLHIDRLRPLLGPKAPAVSGTLEASAVYAVLGGVPGLRGQLKIVAPQIGLLQLDRIEALMDYNPFARRLTIAKETPLFFDKAGYRILAHGTVNFPADLPPRLELELETPVEQEVLPVSAFLAENELFEAEGGLEGLFLRVRGTFEHPELYGEALVGLREIQFLGESVLSEVTGPSNSPGAPAVIVFRNQTVMLEDRQFWLVNRKDGREGRVAMEGSLDLAALFGDAPGREIGAIRLRPESPGAVIPVTGFGLNASLRVPDPENPIAGTGRPLRVVLRGQELQLAGDLQLVSGTFDVGGLGRFAELGKTPDTPSDAGATPAFIGPLLAYDIGIGIPDDFLITGPTRLRMTLESGHLQLRGNALAPDLIGIIRAKSGSLGLLGKEFRLVEPATLTFSSLYSLDPLIQAKAETRVDTLDPTALSGHRTVVITATVNAHFQSLDDDTGEGILFASNDGLYSTPSQILALLAGFGGDRGSQSGDDEMGSQMLRGLGNAAVSIPGQFIGQLFEEQGFQRFLIGANIDGDIFVDAEYELSDNFSVDYKQTFGVERDWEAGVRYQFRDNSFVRLGTNEDFDVIGAVEYRIPIGEENPRKSLEEIADEEIALAEKNRLLDEAAQTPQDPATAMDDDHVIEEIPGQPEVDSEAVEDAEEDVANANE